jgi:hypothetical protein
MGLDDCPHCGAELEITWTTANPGALLGDQVAVPRAMRCPNANRDEVQRLRGLLARLEWAGTTCWNDGEEEESCPACGGTQEEGHLEAAQRIGPDGKPFDSSGCWLAKELGR